MKLTLEQSRKLRNARILLIAGLVLGPLYTLFSDGLGSLYPYVNSALVGIVIALSVSLFEFILFKGQLRRLAFNWLLLLRVGLYSLTVIATIFLVLTTTRSLLNDVSSSAVLRSAEFQNYLRSRDFMASCLYALAAVTITIFILQVRRKIGPKILLGFITGRYYHPQEVERIVMFIDIPHGKTIIEKIGQVRYFDYLNDILFDVTEIILYRRADIYEYVGSNILLTWDLAEGLERANCVRTFFEMKEVIDGRKIRYYDRYGFIPEFRAALHCGTVIRGEIGDVKSEVKYHGDVMNTTARILGKTDAQNPLLISATLLDRLDLPVLYRQDRLGAFELKGKYQAIELFRLSENEELA